MKKAFRFVLTVLLAIVVCVLSEAGVSAIGGLAGVSAIGGLAGVSAVGGLAGATEVYAASRPAKVTGLTAKSDSASSVVLKWKKAKGAKGYQIFRVTKKGSKKIATVKGASKRKYTVKKLKSDTKYSFKVRAYTKVSKKAHKKASNKVKMRYGKFSRTVSVRVKKKVTALLIIDGFGVSEKTEHNAVALADTPVLDKLKRTCPYATAEASGLAVGLPEGQMGSSEVGHLNIGAGRVVYQDLVRISKSIDDGTFYENEALLKAVNNAKEKGSSLHLCGLASDGGVHSHIKHLYGLLELAKRNGLEKVYVHFLTDGRDTAPQCAEKYVKELQDEMDRIGCGKIATVGGRYYAMDRDNNWDRIEKAYRAMTLGEGETADSAMEAVAKSYEKGVSDEYILPTVIMEKGAPVATIKDDDSVVFFNFRPDRAREITRTFCAEDFDGFDRGPRKKVTYVCFTDYDPTIPNKEIAFDREVIHNTFGEWIASQGMKQVRIAESEKAAHVSYFFNGGRDVRFEGEDRITIPSPKVATYDLEPEMSVNEVCDTMINKISSGRYEVVITNFANADMVGHTGVEPATIKAVESIDKCLGRLVKAVKKEDAQLLICADHGNCEKMVDEETGQPWTAHTTNPVPLILVNYDDKYTLRDGGILGDVAPTLIQMMGKKKPAEMTGKSLLVKRR